MTDSTTSDATLNTEEQMVGLLEEVKQYIEDMEVQSDGEWGSSRSAEELIAEHNMPKVYWRIVKAIGTNGLLRKTKLTEHNKRIKAILSKFYIGDGIDDCAGSDDVAMEKGIKELIEYIEST